MFRNKIILLFFFCNHSFSAQTIKIICGQLFDSDNKQSITGAIIQWDSKTFTTSDKNGFFCLKTNSIKGELSVSMVGYKSKVFEIEKTDSDSVFLSLSLNIDAMLDEVVISAGRFEQKRSEVTVSMDLIKPELIHQKNATQLDQIITQVPGVTFQDGQASIRGGSGFSYGAGSRVLMLLDDMPMISADAGDIKWSFIPIEIVEQIEVTKGASSVLYGSGALNGVIHLRTRYARDKPYTQVTTFLGNYDAPRNTYKWWKGRSQFQRGLTITHIQKIKNSDISFSGQYLKDDGYRFLENENRARMHLSWNYKSKKIKGLSNKFSGAFLQNKGGLFYLWQNYDSAFIPQNRKLQALYSLNGNLDNVTDYINTANHFKLTWRNRYFYTNNLNSTSHMNYSELQFQKQLQEGIVFNSGIIGIRSETISESVYGNHLGQQYAFYNQLDATWIKKLHLTIGLRMEHAKLDKETSEFNWFGVKRAIVPVLRFGANYEVWKGANIRASYGQGYRFPSTAEKYVNTGVSVLKIFPNPNLKAERGENMEIGIKQGFIFGSLKGQIDAAAFWTRYDNMIEFVFNYYNTDPNLPLNEKLNYYGFRSENLGKSDIKGLEIIQSMFYNYKHLSFQSMGGYTFINPLKPDFNIQRDTLGLYYPFLDSSQFNVLKYRSKHLFKWDINITYKKLSLGWSCRYQSRVLNIDNRFIRPIFEELGNGFEADDAPSILPGLKANWNEFSKSFWVHDLRCNYQMTRSLTVAYIVNNVTNTSFQTRPGDMRPPRLHQFQITFTPAYKN